MRELGTCRHDHFHRPCECVPKQAVQLVVKQAQVEASQVIAPYLIIVTPCICGGCCGLLPRPEVSGAASLLGVDRRTLQRWFGESSSPASQRAGEDAGVPTEERER